ncbi:hypothetical protein GGR57DRAFT_104984 [Xylariaceae sp. FL1272]|nr:hypothetical protein GGR57DRAFT_104984 [Xylariaceae sp. FL1272]
MTTRAPNTLKACEPCRKAKARCDGERPCRRCLSHSQPSECSYRLRARTRKSTRQAHRSDAGDDSPRSVSLAEVRVTPRRSEWQEAASSGSSLTPSQNARVELSIETDATIDLNQAGDNVYHPSVSAVATRAQSHDLERPPEDSPFTSRLFYGPSSAFAFSQQVYRILWQRATEKTGRQVSERLGNDSDPVQDAGPGLTLFKQKSIFFGIPSRTDQISRVEMGATLRDRISLEQAVHFLELFNATVQFTLPLFSLSELLDMLHAVYDDNTNESVAVQSRCTITASIAISALHTSQTDLAESLFLQAKQESIAYSEEVSLTMIHFTLLLATYQNHMGRPHSAYIHTGAATRKMFALGLNNYGFGKSDNLPQMMHKHRGMVWCVYYHETVNALFLGRESTLLKASIRVPLPEQHPVLVGLCKLAQIVEDGVFAIYNFPGSSLWKLYQVASEIYNRLQICADELGIGPAATPNATPLPPVTTLHLHNIYYHTLLLTFRPFLIAEYALHSNATEPAPKHMWLRRACTLATEAARDSIIFMKEGLQNDANLCKTVRFNAFYLECSCMVLLFDALRYPSKLSFNQEYIDMALQYMKEMVKDDPIRQAQMSVEETARIVRESVLGDRAQPMYSGSVVGGTGTDLASQPTLHQGSPFGHPNQLAHEFIVDDAQHMLYLNASSDITRPSDPAIVGGTTEMSHNYCNSNFITPDLFNFFPLNTLDGYTYMQ